MNKKFSQRVKKVLGDFLLNSEKGVKTPSWRILGIKKCHNIRIKNLLLKISNFDLLVLIFYNKEVLVYKGVS